MSSVPTRTADLLNAADLRRSLGLLDECAQAADLLSFRETVVESMGRFFGFRHATFFLGTDVAGMFADPSPVVRGRATRLVGQYVEAAHLQDPFAQSAVLPMYRSRGVVALDHLTPLRRQPATEEYLRGFLFRGGIHAKLVIPLPADGATGGIGLLAEDSGSFGPREIELARLLGRHLTGLLRLYARQLPPREPAQAAVRLSPRQADVVRLVAAGLTNRQIAQTLVVGVDTVKKHLTRALDLSGCANRTQLALAWRAGTVR